MISWLMKMHLTATLPCLVIRTHTRMYEDLFRYLDNVRLRFLVYNNRNVNNIVYFTLKPKKNTKDPLLQE
jgi:hypothetical protein